MGNELRFSLLLCLSLLLLAGSEGLAATCSGCGKTVSDSYRAGDCCPYCGARWSSEIRVGVGPGTQEPATREPATQGPNYAREALKEQVAGSHQGLWRTLVLVGAGLLVASVIAYRLLFAD